MTGIRQPANGWLRLASPTHRLVGTVGHQAGVYLLPTGASLGLPTGPASTAALLAAFTTGWSRYPFTVGRNFVRGGGEPRPGRSTAVLTSPVRARIRGMGPTSSRVVGHWLAASLDLGRRPRRPHECLATVAVPVPVRKMGTEAALPCSEGHSIPHSRSNVCMTEEQLANHAACQPAEGDAG